MCCVLPLPISNVLTLSATACCRTGFYSWKNDGLLLPTRLAADCLYDGDERTLELDRWCTDASAGRHGWVAGIFDLLPWKSKMMPLIHGIFAESRFHAVIYVRMQLDLGWIWGRQPMGANGDVVEPIDERLYASMEPDAIGKDEGLLDL
ncbi:hypothetical protein ACLOJK_034847 [Asimina triloba]